jgi:NAD-dependent DNA ligase
MTERPTDKMLRSFHGKRLDARQMDELVGLARGMSADGAINQAEVEYLQKWLVAYADVRENPLVIPLLERVNGMLADRKLDAEEAKELLETLREFSGSDFELGEPLKATTLPLDDPLPTVIFGGNRFCFTGTFAYGSRSECEDIATTLGAECGSLTKKTNYLVIGMYATDSWKHSSFGNKIERAVEMRQGGVPLSIIDEQHWRVHLPNFGDR